MNSPAASRRSTRSRSGRASPATSPRSRFTEGAIVRTRRPAVPDRSAAVPGRSRSPARRAHPRARHGAARRRPSCSAPSACAAENAMSQEEHDRRAAFAQESAAQVAAVEAALRAAELNLEFTHVTSPISGRVGRAIVTEGNLVSSGPGEATLLTTVVSLDPIYAHFDADERIFLQLHRPARANASTICRFAWRSPTTKGFPRQGRLDFLDNQLDPATGTIRGRAVFRNPDGVLTPGLFVRLRLAGSGTSRALLIQDRAVGTDLDKKFVLVVGAGQDRPVPHRDARPDRRRPARRAQRPEGRRSGGRQRSAARAPRREGGRLQAAPMEQRGWSTGGAVDELLAVLHRSADLRGRAVAGDRHRRRARAVPAADQRVPAGGAADRRRARDLSRREPEGHRRDRRRRRSSSRSTASRTCSTCSRRRRPTA